MSAQDIENSPGSPELCQVDPNFIRDAILNCEDLTELLPDIPPEFCTGISAAQMTSLIRDIAEVSAGRDQEETVGRVLADFRARYPLLPMMIHELRSRIDSLYMVIFNLIFF